MIQMTQACPITAAPRGPSARQTQQLRPAREEDADDARAWVAVIDGTRHALRPGVLHMIGASDDADVRVACGHVSRRHATLRHAGRRVEVGDLGSTNGVWVGGRRVQRAYVEEAGVFRVGRQPVVLARAVGRRCVDALTWEGMIGRDPATLALWSRLAAAAVADAPVWLWGETGSGKERAAHALHRASARADEPFVALNCAALPAELAEAELFGVTRGAFTGAERSRPGAFARADGGSLLLDEVGELPLPVQAKLLRALEVGEVQPVGAEAPLKVDVRVIAASWKDLEAEAALGRFRDDLLHRLWVLRVDVPPLRERPRDVLPLLEALLEAVGAAHLWPGRGLLEALETAPWRGNVRELRNHVIRAACDDDPTLLLPERERALALAQLMRRGPSGAANGRGALQRALREHRGNRTRAAQALGVSRSTLYRWLRSARP